MRFAARTFLIILFALCSLLFATQAAHAQYTNSYVTPNTDANVPANLHTYTQSVTMEVLAAVTCQIIGIDPITTSHQCLGINTATGKIGYVPSNGGAVGFVGTMISSLYTPPIHTTDYMQYVASNFGLVKHTYAATSNGIGFDKLTPLLSLWTTFRNLSYLVFVIIFIAIGFAIMLRVKIDPRTVMTIENQIPKIIIGLLLVTFSYAIAGFLIDMMYVTTYLTVNVLTTSQESTPNFTQAQKSTIVGQIHNTETNNLSGGNPLGFANDIIPGGLGGLAAGSAGGVKDLINNLMTGQIPNQSEVNWGNGLSSALIGLGSGAAIGAGIGVFFGGAGAVPGAIIGGIIGLIGGTVAGASGIAGQIPQITANVFGTLLGLVAGLLAFLVIAIALLVALFRVWLALLLAYVNILLEIVLAPFFIIAGVFPGSKVGFGSWIKSMIGNLLAFPVTVAMFLLAGIFMYNFDQNTANLFVPPLIGNPNGSVNGHSPVGYLIALGMVLLTPNVVTLTRGLVGAGDNKALGGIFAGIGVGGKATSGIFRQSFGALFGNEIEYQSDGSIKTLSNPLDRFRKGFVRKVSG